MVDTSPAGEKSLADLGLSVAALFITVWVCKAAELDSNITTGLSGMAVLLPAAIKANVKKQQLTSQQEVAALEGGHMGRPLGLVLSLFIGAIIILDSVGGYLAISLAVDSPRNAETIIYTGTAILAVVVFLIASYASHYMGDEPYLWTAVGIGGVVVVRLAILGLFDLLVDPWIQGVIVGHLIYLVAALAGTWYGRQNHDKFIAARLQSARLKL
jgi:hypothetical protein